ncbi:uncharacterized protein LOC142177304 [Nicotiana tabacum]|uniref:Uncharacterized protein LOC142177304 n=1 Tax=Nicotiana tabacum TaxID=4097 RepID=A0AC58TXC2_TOBAC
MDQNMELCKFSTIEKVKGAVFALGGDSSSGPDGFTGMFYQEYWDIVGEDIFKLLQEFYGDTSFPKSITHTNLVLLPKKPQVQTFSDLRLISLSNFINKVISRVLHDRLEKILPYLISSNQYVFVKGRSIFENIFLTQEIVTDIRLRVVEVLILYEQTFQLINKIKSSYYMHDNVAGELFNTVGAITGFQRGKFPFTYLGCPIFYTRRRKDYYGDLFKKVKAKLHSWKGKLLSFGGKALISSVLQSLPTHILSVLEPPDNILEHSYKIFASFFWSTKEEGRSKHWTKWQNLCLPKEKGALGGFRSLFDVSKALFA